MKKLFGTDGIRGVAGAYPLDASTVRRFGAALAAVFHEEHGGRCRVALGRDTRESGVRLRDAVLAGLVAHGGSAVDAGVISTPGLAHALVAGGFDAGVMISASHNPFRDNGLKAFGRDGMKLSDAMELRVEEHMLSADNPEPPDRDADLREDPGLVAEYVTYLEGLLSPRGRLKGLRLVLDCANGSACRIAPEVFRHHGAEILCIGNQPNGMNINLDCGSLHLDRLAETVRANDCDMGIAFDGDADRCLAVDRTGRVLDGDHILFLTGRRLHRSGRLPGNALVATIMSNLWLEKRLEQEGIALHRAPVGDKYVLERMLAENATLGGEQSGHVIFREHATTGDGILTGLLLVDALIEDGDRPETILDGIEPYPQILLNVAVRSKPDLRQHPRVGPAVLEVERALAGSGRVVLRYSGTEPLARIMVEGADADSVREHAERLARLVERELGA